MRNRLFLALLMASTLPGLAAAAVQAQWPWWGGPSGDFRVDSKGLAGSWPEGGPPRLWSRELGDGYSAIVVDADRLYTMVRKGGEEVVVALEAATGKTIWEHGYAQAIHPRHLENFGIGPRATPAIAGDRIFTVGLAGRMHCLDKKTGRAVWSRNLWEEFEATFLGNGYCSSPIPYRNTVIVLAGGKENSIIAFDQEDGSVVWKKHDFRNSYSSPRLITVDGQDQLLCFMAEELVSVDPRNGRLYWSYEIRNQWGQNISPPVFDDTDDMLLLSTTYAGSRGLKLTRDGESCRVEEVWSVLKVQFYHATVVGIGDHVYGSHGNGVGQVSLFSCIDRLTGEILWRERGLGKANTIYADGKLIILDEEGVLALARANPERLEILEKVQVLEEPAWTVPTLAGTTLYLRDQKKVVALDLG